MLKGTATIDQPAAASLRCRTARVARYEPANTVISGCTIAVARSQAAAPNRRPSAAHATASSVPGVDSDRDVMYGSRRYRLVPATGIVSTEATSAVPHHTGAGR